MEPLLSKIAWGLGTIGMFVLRAPHIRRSTELPVARNAISRREVVLLGLVGVGLLLLPLIWVFTPWLDFAEREPTAPAFGLGVGTAAAGLWLLHRSHAALGPNWSNTLQVRQGHRLVTGGVYRRVRHPMYAAILLHALGQALYLPNGVAGPAYLLAFILLVLLRIGPEERLMHETFGDAWQAYAVRTRRLLPGVW